MNKKALPSFTLLLAAALTLSACGGDDPTSTAAVDSGPSESPSETEQPSNDADVAFAQQMIPHHTQAIEMAKLAEDRAGSAEVQQLATDIEAAQGPEIDQLSTWLEEWGEEVPSGSMEHGDTGHDGHGSDPDADGETAGMMTEDDMAMLEEASGAEFDRMFLEMMVTHHEGAVSMAETEVAEGEHADAIAMARQIIATQEDEIQQMQQLLSA